MLRIKAKFGSGVLTIEDKVVPLMPISPCAKNDPIVFSAIPKRSKSQIVVENEDEDEQTPLETQIPYADSTEPKNPNLLEYSYDLFVYRALEHPQKAQHQKKFICTGSSSTTTKSYIVKALFIPLEDLEQRVKGTETQRTDAYLKDWLTFLAHNETSLKCMCDKLKIPCQIDTVSLRRHYDGSHLHVRDKDGYSAAGLREKGPRLKDHQPLYSIKFLSYMFDNNGFKGAPGGNLPKFIFQRWCGTYSTELPRNTPCLLT